MELKQLQIDVTSSSEDDDMRDRAHLEMTPGPHGAERPIDWSDSDGSSVEGDEVGEDEARANF